MPDWKNLVRQRFTSLNLTPDAESELTDELSQHLEDCYRDLRRGGAGEEEAYRTALSELDGDYPLQASVERNRRMPKHSPVPAGDAGTGRVMSGVWRDLRYALRSMRKNPIFVVFVVMTLALGIGANTTVFTVLNTLILNPLPVRNAAALANVSAAESAATSKSGTLFPISYVDLKDYRARNGVFDSLAGYTYAQGVTWQQSDASQGMFSELVTHEYFSTLGLNPARGRFFLPEEDSVPGAHAVVVMNHATWQTRLGGAEDIIGRKLRVNNIVFSVIGVAPPKFIGVNAIFGPDLWMPAAMAERLFPNTLQNALSDRNKAVFQGVGRLKAGVTRAQAQDNLAAIASALAHEYTASVDQTIRVRPLRDALFGSARGGSAPILFGGLALLIVVGIVLLIACSNVANLMLARSAARQQEMAVRLAMGASRARLVRQLLTESVLLGGLAGAVGLILADAGLQLLFGALPGTANFPTPKLDATVLIFALIVSLTTGFLFGTIPALKASRTRVAEALKDDARTAGRSRSRVTIANALLVGQVAFSFLLLVAAALFLRSIRRAYDLDPGFQTAHLAVFPANPGQAGYEKPQTKAFYDEVHERAARVPGVDSVSWSSNMPLWARAVNGLQVEGRQQRSQSDTIRAVVITVDRNYFETAGVVMESGREFTKLDRDTSTAVAIVNEKMAQDYWPGGALGKRIRLPGEKQMRQIVGIARTANYTGLAEPPQACVYVPLEQNYSDGMVLYVRSKGDPRKVLQTVEREIRSAGPQVLISGVRTGSEIIDGGLFQARMGVILLTVFGLVALGLASIGLYGIVAYSVRQRRREIGLRMALGATQATVLKLILREGMSLVLSGVVIGLTASLLVGRLLAGMLYGLSASDPASITVAAGVLSAVALLACYLPARWATRVDPIAALRET